MADSERKSLVWDIRKSLLALSPEKLFRIVVNIGPVPGKDQAELCSDDPEGCFEFIHAFMYSEKLLEAEDRGMGELLALQDYVNEVTKSTTTTPSTEPANLAPSSVSCNASNVASASAAYVQSDLEEDSNLKLLPDDVKKMLSDYEDLTKKLMHFVNHPSTQTVTPGTQTQPTSSLSTSLDVGGQSTHDQVVSLKELSFLHRREFKVQGGQIGDHTSDISFNSVCRQIEEGVKDNLTDSEIVRGVLKIIKPGNFKDMLINKEDMTVDELRGFLQSHLGEKNSTELFQELMCAKQSDHETPQQFLYRVIGLKQRVLFESKQPGAGIKYSPDSVQGVFLHTVYQGIGHKHSDIRRELKPLLSDNTVSDEAILRHVMRVTSDESERQRRLGPKNMPQSIVHMLMVKM